MEGVHGSHERPHHLIRVGPQLLDLLPEPPEMGELRDRHPAERRLVGEGRRERGILAETEERDKLGVGQQSKQVEEAIPACQVVTANVGHSRSLTTLTCPPLRKLPAMAPLRIHVKVPFRWSGQQQSAVQIVGGVRLSTVRGAWYTLLRPVIGMW